MNLKPIYKNFIITGISATTSLFLSGCAMTSPDKGRIDSNINTANSTISHQVDKTLQLKHKKETAGLEIKNDSYYTKIKSQPLWLQTYVALNGRFTLTQIFKVLFASNHIMSINNQVDLSKEVDLNYRGNVAELLPILSNLTNLTFITHDHTVEVKSVLTKQFYVDATPGTANFSVGQGMMGTSDSSNGSSSGTTSSNTNHDTGDVSVWKDVENTVKNLISKDGSYSIQQSTSILTVTDHVQAIRRISNWLNQYNKALSLQVSFKVQILTIRLDKGYRRGIDWNILYHDLSVGQSLIASAPSIASYDLASVDSLMGLIIHKGGSHAVVQYLKQFGEIYTNQQPILTTINNKMAQLNQLQRTRYLKQITTSIIPSAGSNSTQVSLEPGSVDTGLELNILPHIFNNKIYMKVDLSLANLDAITSKGSGDDNSESIQLPVTSTQQFNQSAVLRNGQSLLLGGYITHKDGYSNTSNFNSQLLGTDSSGLSTYETIFLITPYINTQRQIK